MHIKTWLRQSLAALIALVCVVGVRPARATEPSPSLLDRGYDDMYNLQFQDAHKAFGEWEQSHPQDPLGPASDAAAYVFSEFNRLHVLEFELFTDDSKMVRQPKLPPDPQLKQAFEAQLDRSSQLAASALQRNPRDGNALFANVLVLGLRGDYSALIEKRYLTGLGYMKQARSLAERMTASNPGYYDAYLAVGIENYLLSLKPAPVRWLLRLDGAETDKKLGVEKLQMVAEKGHYMLPYARLLLAVAALRDNHPDQARALLEGLARQFPRNPLYRKELAQLRRPAR